VVYRTQRMRPGAGIEPLESGARGVDPGWRAVLERHVAALAAVGFARATWYRATSGGVTSVGVLLEHPEHGDLATVAAMRAELVPTEVFLLFESEWDDDLRVSTSNARVPSVYPRIRGLDGESLPSVEDAARLYRVHRARVERVRHPVPRRPLSRGDDPLGIERARQVANYQRYAPLGYSRREGEFMRPTLRGAFLMCWRLLPPLKQLALRARARREAALLRELGFQG
jgi:hypothetical protein